MDKLDKLAVWAVLGAAFEKNTKCEDCPCFYKTEGAFNDECQLTHKEIENYFIIDKSCPLKGGK